MIIFTLLDEIVGLSSLIKYKNNGDVVDKAKRNVESESE